MPEKYWCDFFGLRLEELRKPGFKVVNHKGLMGYKGAWIFKIGQSVIISVPDDIKNSVQEKVNTWINGDDILSRAFAEQIFENIERTIGPCYQGFCTEESLIVLDSEKVKLLESNEYSFLEKLRHQVNQDAWDQSSLSPDKMTFVYFEGGEIIAAACLDMWDEGVANIGLLTSPSRRGRGCAKELCSFATANGLAKGYQMVYQTLSANAAAVAVARSAGYIEYANHMAVRFKPDKS